MAGDRGGVSLPSSKVVLLAVVEISQIIHLIHLPVRKEANTVYKQSLATNEMHVFITACGSRLSPGSLREHPCSSQARHPRKHCFKTPLVA